MSVQFLTRPWCWGLLAALVCLMALSLPAAADTLYMRFCPSDAAIASGVPPACDSTPMLLDMKPGACDSMVEDLSDPVTLPALIQAFPNSAQHYAQYSGWPVSAWCVGLAADFTIPNIPGG